MTSAFRPDVRARLPALVGLRFLINTTTRMTYAFLSPLAAGAGMSRESMSVVIGARDLTSLSSPVVGSVSGRLGYAQVLRVGVGLVIVGSVLSMFGATGLVIGFVIFLMVKQINKMTPKEEPAPAPAGPTQEELLAEIRDLLKK